MIWLIIGALGILGFLALLVLAPVWAGMSTLWESLVIFGISVATTAVVGFFVFAVVNGVTQVFG